ncbi:MAG: hypothetical protein ACNA7Z_02980 [Dethiobacteria bacterium]
MFLNKRFIIILTLLCFSFFLFGCGAPEVENSAAGEEEPEPMPEPISEEHQAQLDALLRDLEAMKAVNEDDSSQDQNSGTSSTAVDGFKHEVKMDIDGVIEEGHEEEWWVID